MRPVRQGARPPALYRGIFRPFICASQDIAAPCDVEVARVRGYKPRPPEPPPAPPLVCLRTTPSEKSGDRCWSSTAANRSQPKKSEIQKYCTNRLVARI